VTVVDQDSTKCKQVRFKNRFAYACVDVWKKDAFDGVGLPIWSISLKPAYGGVAIPQSTYGDGWVRFKVQSPGDYTVVETPEAGWHSIGNNSFNLTLEASGTCTSVTFCNLQDNMTLPATPGCVAGISGGPTLQTVIPTTPTPTPSQSQSGSCSQYYTVVSGDTFYRIANLFGKSIGDLEAANPTVNPQTIYPNTVLCIP
jgi:LysM repeat protein